MKRIWLIPLVIIIPVLVYAGAVYDPILGKMRSSDSGYVATELTSILGTGFDSEVELIALTPIPQAASVDNAGTITPTAGYRRVDIQLTAVSDPSAITLGETGAINDAVVSITNISANTATFGYSAGVFEHNGGAGKSLVLEQWQTIVIQYISDRWVLQSNESSSVYFKSIELSTIELDELSDTTGDRLLTDAELKSNVISNKGATGATVFNMPALAEGRNFEVIIEAAQNISIVPNGTEQFYLNGTQMAAGEAIVNEAPTVAESIVCITTETAWYFESKYSDFAQDTP